MRGSNIDDWTLIRLCGSLSIHAGYWIEKKKPPTPPPATLASLMFQLGTTVAAPPPSDSALPLFSLPAANTQHGWFMAGLKNIPQEGKFISHHADIFYRPVLWHNEMSLLTSLSNPEVYRCNLPNDCLNKPRDNPGINANTTFSRVPFEWINGVIREGSGCKLLQTVKNNRSIPAFLKSLSTYKKTDFTALWWQKGNSWIILQTANESEAMLLSKPSSLHKFKH